jgi:hypothetical protein
MDAARDSGDMRLRIIAARELRPLLDLWTKLRDRARDHDDDVRQKAFQVLSSLPDSFIRSSQPVTTPRLTPS